MPRLSFPIAKDGLRVEALIGLDSATTITLAQAGSPITPPSKIKALLDTGSDVSAAAPRVLQQLGLTPAQTVATYTAGGYVSVDLYRVSLTILDTLSGSGPMFTKSSLWVTELAVPLPGIEVLIGLNVVLDLVLTVDGPRQTFTLDF